MASEPGLVLTLDALSRVVGDERTSQFERLSLVPSHSQAKYSHLELALLDWLGVFDVLGERIHRREQADKRADERRHRAELELYMRTTLQFNYHQKEDITRGRDASLLLTSVSQSLTKTSACLTELDTSAKSEEPDDVEQPTSRTERRTRKCQLEDERMLDADCDAEYTKMQTASSSMTRKDGSGRREHAIGSADICDLYAVANPMSYASRNEDDLDELVGHLVPFKYARLVEEYLGEVLTSHGRGRCDVDEHVASERSVWSIASMRDRHALYNRWTREYRQRLSDELARLQHEYNASALVNQELRQQEDRGILERAYIVAMTTTGSAR